MTKEEENILEVEFNKKYSKYIRRIEERNFLRKKKMEIRKLKRDNRKKLGITTTKLLCYYLFITCNALLIYAMVAMWHFADLTYLGVIITDIIGQVLIYCIYSVRAFKDTQSEENVKLEREKINSLPNTIRDKIEGIFDMVDNLTSSNNEEPSGDNTESVDIESSSEVNVEPISNELVEEVDAEPIVELSGEDNVEPTNQL